MNLNAVSMCEAVSDNLDIISPHSGVVGHLLNAYSLTF
jgi:hypothetical protein